MKIMSLHTGTGLSVEGLSEAGDDPELMRYTQKHNGIIAPFEYAAGYNSGYTAPTINYGLHY